MRAISLPIDTQRVQFPFAGTVRPVIGWDQASGKSTGEQAMDNGVPLWEVDVLIKIPGFGGDVKTETISVRVPARTEPKLPDFAPIGFEHLELSAYLSRGDLRVNLSAAGIVGGPRGEQKAA